MDFRFFISLHIVSKKQLLSAALNYKIYLEVIL
jgi:hypothetical protein